MPSSKPSEAVSDTRLRRIVESYQRLTGQPLFAGVPAGADELRTALWEAPRAIVAHGTEADPIFFYGNRRALELFEMSFEEFTRLPSRLSAEAVAQDARMELLKTVARQGYVDGYVGMRIAKSGKRFMIGDCTVWNLLDEAGTYHGQAAVFVTRT